MFQYKSHVHTPVTRAYSMANYPGEKGIIKLNVRIASPPPRGPADIPPGQASSYIFNLKEGDEVTIAGPFGEFFIEESDTEMVYVGGGAGMAPLRMEAGAGKKSFMTMSLRSWAVNSPIFPFMSPCPTLYRRIIGQDIQVLSIMSCMKII